MINLVLIMRTMTGLGRPADSLAEHDSQVVDCGGLGSPTLWALLPTLLGGIVIKIRRRRLNRELTGNLHPPKPPQGAWTDEPTHELSQVSIAPLLTMGAHRRVEGLL
jgi:hypothetical protein